jgi:hypothetical protein
MLQNYTTGTPSSLLAPHLRHPVSTSRYRYYRDEILMEKTTMSRVTAVFDNRSQAEQAVSALRQLGVTDTQLSVLARNGDDLGTGGAGSATADAAADTAGDTGKGLLAGAGVGALFGLAAAMIPGVGPFITAGWLASALGAAGGGAAAGAIVGGTSGAIAGALTNAGYDKSEADYYGSAVESGGTLVAVDTAGAAVSDDQVRATLAQYGGRSSGAMA